jgi:diacylglycerol O-acyltransferase
VRQLSSLDTQFLALESARQTGHVAGLAILDPSTAPDGRVDAGTLSELLTERLPALPPMRWRLAEVPLGLDYPYWIDDPDFDLDFHVRELALPAPGSDEQLAEQVARIVSRPLDRSRPLWELYVIHGLPDGNVAVLTKIHHAVIDGMSGAEIMGLLLDLSPEGREPPAPVSDGEARTPSGNELLVRGLLGLSRQPLRAVRAIPRALPNIEETPFASIPGAGLLGSLGRAPRTLRRDGSAQGGPRFVAPKTMFNGRISPHRRFAFGEMSLADVKKVKDAYGATVNDLVVALCAGAVRRWLVEHNDLPGDPLIAQIPVSVRTDEQMGTYGNRILIMAAPLATNLEDPVARLKAARESMLDLKARHKALPAELLQDVNHFIPPAVFARAAQLTFRLATTSAGRPNWNLVISNVPGPQFPLYMAGARLKANYPVSVITDGMGLNITVMSYNGTMDFGIVADREQMPDVWKLIDWLHEELRELADAAGVEL